jgi:hypothetical protein
VDDSEVVVVSSTAVVVVDTVVVVVADSVASEVVVDVVDVEVSVDDAGLSTATSSQAVNRKSDPHFSDALPRQFMLQSSSGTGPLLPCSAREHQHSPLHSVPAKVKPSFWQVEVHPAFVMLAKPPITSSV